MLKYNIRVSDDNIKQEAMVWSEKYLSPDLSFVSGVTSQDYHLEKYTKLSVSNKLSTSNNSIMALASKNVTRQGYVVIKNKEYEVISDIIMDYSNSDIVKEYKYIFINGKYYYLKDNKFVISNWLTEKYDSNGISYIVEEEKTIEYTNSNIVKIDTIVWIEDGIVNIDGNDYFFDKNEKVNASTKGGLKYFENGNCLEAENITNCSDIIIKPFSSNNDYIKVTKFSLTKQDDNLIEDFEEISHCSRYYYAAYKNHYYAVKQKFERNNIDETFSSYNFVCEIPIEEPIDHELYNVDDDKPINSENFLLNRVHDLNDLYKIGSYIKVENCHVPINHEIMNASNGRELIIYLKDGKNTVAVGDKIELTDEKKTQVVQNVYSGRVSSDSFVTYNGEKYKIVNSLCDKVKINNNEYDIIYINGKVTNKDCLVSINNEQVPMKIVDEASKLSRYGNIVTGDGKSSSVTVTYDIFSYDGVIINGKKYIIQEDNFIYLNEPNKFTFVVNEKIGNSLLVCEPLLNEKEYEDEFVINLKNNICNYIVDNKHTILLKVKNNIFGDKEITSKLAFQSENNPTSSDDYFNLFDNLELYTRNGYINLPIGLSALQGNNIMQDDLVKNEFFEEEKKKAINPIIDMEKCIYYPKYISNKNRDDDEKTKYIGSETDFNPIEEIRFNLHFRSRNLNSWKVNEGYNNVAANGNDDNWFVTDFHPYSNILNNGTTEDKIKLMESSDILGLLLFTNDDVYYQKKKISRSFLRLSFYDSVDSQTQNLLATSTIFMDGHKLYKTFIDNSRKNINDYGLVVSPDTESGMTLNKISVNTEYLGSRKENGNKYISRNNQYVTSFEGTKLDDEHRLGSEFVVLNKYETETSSEGFYLYMFKEESENLHPKPIYMKVEFNHAGIGRTIPFNIPMKWTSTDADGNKYPESALTFTSSEDIETLKKGIKLTDVYAQSYIPLYAVYDFKNKQYAYVFDDRYVKVKTSEEDDHERVVLNLFELKVMNETETDEEIEEKQKAITYRKQETAKININDAFNDSI